MGNITRRAFIKFAGLTSVILLTGFPRLGSGEIISNNFFDTPVGRQRLNIIKTRQAGQYKDDLILREKFKMAASHENPMIKRFYSEFAHHPLSEVSEALLHTHYKARV
ncbi:iron hydrogenase small subunit [Thermodesulfovibrio sp. 3907-1M]|uniref:Iron hydrogenase small subunit n=1 Tax=Thermodesulfovibrio autotrophicus TaxID=3118333 RepID=A0AAU8GY57_9BACT